MCGHFPEDIFIGVKNLHSVQGVPTLDIVWIDYDNYRQLVRSLLITRPVHLMCCTNHISIKPMFKPQYTVINIGRGHFHPPD